MNKVYLLDGHGLLYKAFHALGPLSNSAGEPTGAIYGFLQTFQRLRREYDPRHFAVVFDPPGKSFRANDFAEYKANRPPQPPELATQLALLKELLGVMKVPMFEVSEFEADDVIATLAKWAVDNGGEAMIVSTDKDLYQCVGPRVTILRDHLSKVEILDEEGVRGKTGVAPGQIPAYLGLLGDTADNIPGVPGIGKKRAADLLNEFGDLESILAEAQGKTKPKFWASLAENAEAARLSRQLATVRDDVQVPGVSWDALEWTYEPCEELRQLYIRLEFRGYVDEMGGATVAERTIDYDTIITREEFAEAVRAIKTSGLAAIDTETTGLDPFSDRLVGFSISWAENQAVYVPIASQEHPAGLAIEDARDLLNPLLSDSGVRWIAHNWAFDYKMLRASGFDAGNIAVDTMIASYLIAPDKRMNGLKDLALERLGIKMTAIDQLVGDSGDMVHMASVDIESISEYACQDADCTRQLAVLFEPELDRLGLRKLYDEIEMPLVTVLARMEMEGVRIDRAHFKRLSGEVAQRLQILTGEITEAAGRPFNLNSPKQLSEILFDELKLPRGKKTSTGYSTDVSVLEDLAQLHPMPAKLLEYRQLEKLRGTYIESLPFLINPRTGRIHTHFNQTIAATGRLSSSDPNLQNIPVRTEEGRKIRAGFVPREEGWKLLAADYSQIELRILAHLSKDPALVRAFTTGEDIHTLTASMITGEQPENVTKEMRNAGKTINFGIIYGMSAFRLARDLGLDRKTAETFIEEYFKAYAGVRAFIDETLEQCRRDGFVTTLLGRRRPIPEIKASNWNTRTQAERIAVNTPIQGTSADMIKIAMLRVGERLDREGHRARMILQVHDELIFDVPEEELAEVEALVREEMTAALPLDVPVVVDAQSGGNWQEI